MNDFDSITLWGDVTEPNTVSPPACQPGDHFIVIVIPQWRADKERFEQVVEHVGDTLRDEFAEPLVRLPE